MAEAGAVGSGAGAGAAIDDDAIVAAAGVAGSAGFSLGRLVSCSPPPEAAASRFPVVATEQVDARKRAADT